jgi:hypothetical protein
MTKPNIQIFDCNRQTSDSNEHTQLKQSTARGTAVTEPSTHLQTAEYVPPFNKIGTSSGSILQASQFTQSYPQFPGLVLPSCQELTLDPLATPTLEAVPFCSTHRSLLSCHSKCILEAVFCEAVQHSLRFCLHHLSRVKMAAFSFSLKQGGWRMTYCLRSKTILVKRKCERTASSFVAKVRGEVFAHFSRNRRKTSQ